MCARDEVRQLGDGKHKDEIEKRLNSRDTHLLLGLCCLHLHPVSLLKALLNRVECCLYILCYTRTFWQANGATVIPNGVKHHLAGFAHSKQAHFFWGRARIIIAQHYGRSEREEREPRPGKHQGIKNERCSREASHLPRRTARVCCSSLERGWSSRASFATCAISALSMSSRPCSVNSNRMPRRSSGSGMRLTSPFPSSRAIRLVIVPDVTIINPKSSVGESRYGGPARRRVASISKLQWFRPNCANTGSSSLSTTSDSREMRPTIHMGETSRSGRSAAHWARMLLT